MNKDFVSVDDYAEVAGISARSVRQRIKSGHIRARKAGKSWHISPDEIYRAKRGYKPLRGKQVALAGFTQLSRFISGDRKEMHPMDKHRCSMALKKFAEQPAPMLEHWSTGRGQQLHWLHVEDQLRDYLREKYEPAGVCAPGHRISAVPIADCRMSVEEFEKFAQDHELNQVSHQQANAVVRVISRDVPRSTLLLACELQDYHDPRTTPEAIRFIEASTS